MFSFKLNQVIFFLFLHGYDCQRRIKDGTEVTEEKRYVVYLLKAAVSPKFYKGWLCGGALVSKEYILTSAACIIDVMHLYAIAGYNKYISDSEIYNDPCTKEKKKKIVYICAPKDYDLVYPKPEKWSNIDIGLAKVESPYDFDDTSFAELCSYTPVSIEVNYDPKYQEPGIDSLILGWGHRTNYRERTDFANHNAATLNYAPTLIQDKEDCKKEYTVFEGMAEVIDQYMICTNVDGNLDDKGTLIMASKPTAQGCLNSAKRLRGDISCENVGAPEDQVVLIENSRKDIKPTNFSKNVADQKSNYPHSKVNGSVVDSYNIHNSSVINQMNGTVLNSRRSNTRRNGICQNDHGGPLVTWIGAHEKVIGVASAYKVSETRECIGPYLYTSTQCNGAFISCLLDPDKDVILRRGICKAVLNEHGLKLVEAHISWKDHPDGPAENEINGTLPSLAVNTDNHNVQVKLMKKEEERNKTYQEHNATKFHNTNITDTNDTTATDTIIDTNFTKTVNVGKSTPISIINIISTSGISNSSNLTNLINNTFTTLTNLDTATTKTTSSKYKTNSSMHNIENTITTILINNTFTTLTNMNTTTTKTTSTKYKTNTSMNNIENTITTFIAKNATTNHWNTTNTNVRNTTPTNVYLKSTNTNLINNGTLTTSNLVDNTSKN